MHGLKWLSYTSYSCVPNNPLIDSAISGMYAIYIRVEVDVSYIFVCLTASISVHGSLFFCLLFYSSEQLVYFPISARRVKYQFLATPKHVFIGAFPIILFLNIAIHLTDAHRLCSYAAHSVFLLCKMTLK